MIVEFIHIISFIMISNETLLPLIFYNRKCDKLYFYHVHRTTLKSRRNVFAEFVLQL